MQLRLRFRGLYRISNIVLCIVRSRLRMRVTSVSPSPGEEFALVGRWSKTREGSQKYGPLARNAAALRDPSPNHPTQKTSPSPITYHRRHPIPYTVPSTPVSITRKSPHYEANERERTSRKKDKTKTSKGLKETNKTASFPSTSSAQHRHQYLSPGSPHS